MGRAINYSWDGVQDIPIYLMVFAVPSRIYVKILVPTQGSEEAPYSFFKMLLIFHPHCIWDKEVVSAVRPNEVSIL